MEDWEDEIKLKKNNMPLDILNYMELCSLVVDYDEDERLGLNIAGECQWYEDGSLSIIIIEDDVKYVGVWDDWNIWDTGDFEYLHHYVYND